MRMLLNSVRWGLMDAKLQVRRCKQSTALCCACFPDDVKYSETHFITVANPMVFPQQFCSRIAGYAASFIDGMKSGRATWGSWSCQNNHDRLLERARCLE